MSEFRVYAWNGNPASPDLRDLLAQSHDLLGASPHYLDAKEIFDHAMIYECAEPLAIISHGRRAYGRVVATTDWVPEEGFCALHTSPPYTKVGSRAKWWLEHRERLKTPAHSPNCLPADNCQE